jgi:Ca2+-binding RTX toxin-like protein
MRKTVVMMALVALLTVVAASVAYAAVKEGNAGDNYIRETCRDDTLIGRGGNDTLDANNCGDDVDRLKGNAGNDRLLANDGDTLDRLRGGPGFDTCVVDRRFEALSGCDRVLVRNPST